MLAAEIRELLGLNLLLCPVCLFLLGLIELPVGDVIVLRGHGPEGVLAIPSLLVVTVPGLILSGPQLALLAGPGFHPVWEATICVFGRLCLLCSKAVAVSLRFLLRTRRC